RAVPDEKPLGQEDVLTDSTAIGIRLTPIFGISIPVIVRLGNLSSKIIISDLVLQKEEDQPLALKIMLNREGTQSVYGDLSVDYTGTDGRQINIGLVKGIAVYTPNAFRRFT